MSTLATTSVVPLYAGFWRRTAAAVLDGLVLLIPNVIVAFLVSDRMLALLADILIAVAYYAGFHSSSAQATPGKKAFGIKVTDLSGGRIGLGRAIGRYFATWLSALILGIGFVMAAFTQKRQALHDMICGTLVVNRNAQAEEVVAGGDVMPVTAGVWVVIAVLLILPFFGGILAAIAIPAYSDYTARSKVADVLNAANEPKQEVESALAEKRPLQTGTVAIRSKYASGAQVTSEGHVVVNVTDDIARGGRIRFTPTRTPGGVQWKCTAEDMPKRVLPVHCRE